MKKQLVSAITILVLFSFSAGAQNNSTINSKIRIGILSGINIADIKSNSNQDKYVNITPIIGFITEFPVAHKLSVKVEPMYLNKGVKLKEGSDVMEEPEAHLKSRYFDLPVLLKYSFLDGISPCLNAGMEVGYQWSTKLDVMFPGLETTVEMTDITNIFELGASFGGGLEIPLNSLNLFFDCNYTIGLTNMQKTGSVTVDMGGVQIPIDYDKDENGYKNRGIQLMVGVTYTIR